MQLQRYLIETHPHQLMLCSLSCAAMLQLALLTEAAHINNQRLRRTHTMIPGHEAVGKLQAPVYAAAGMLITPAPMAKSSMPWVQGMAA